VVAVPHQDADELIAKARKGGIMAMKLGITGAIFADGRPCLIGRALTPIAIGELRKAHEGWFPNYMGGTEIPPSN
jgi:phosphoribosylformylglycinamidine synthase